jgi:hypothetical protein
MKIGDNWQEDLGFIIDDFLDKYRLVIIAVLLGLLLGVSFILGANVSCSRSGGYMSKLACYNIEVKGACVAEDRYYILPEGAQQVYTGQDYILEN